MAALLSCEMDNTDKVVKHINECREKDIDVLPPDINVSRQDFTVLDGKIRFGLAAVKNVGLGAIESILSARDSGGSFTCLADFCSRIDLRKTNKKVLESLIKCGACDCLGKNRAQLLAVLEDVVSMAQRRQKEKEKKQKIKEIRQKAQPAAPLQERLARCPPFPQPRSWTSPQ